MLNKYIHTYYIHTYNESFERSTPTGESEIKNSENPTNKAEDSEVSTEDFAQQQSNSTNYLVVNKPIEKLKQTNNKRADRTRSPFERPSGIDLLTDQRFNQSLLAGKQRADFESNDSDAQSVRSCRSTRSKRQQPYPTRRPISPLSEPLQATAQVNKKVESSTPGQNKRKLRTKTQQADSGGVSSRNTTQHTTTLARTKRMRADGSSSTRTSSQSTAESSCTSGSIHDSGSSTRKNKIRKIDEPKDIRGVRSELQKREEALLVARKYAADLEGEIESLRTGKHASKLDKYPDIEESIKRIQNIMSDGNESTTSCTISPLEPREDGEIRVDDGEVSRTSTSTIMGGHVEHFGGDDLEIPTKETPMVVLNNRRLIYDNRR